MTGVYAIRCLVNGRVYIGSSLDAPRRMHDHARHLRDGKHINAELQAAWREHGARAFVFAMVATPTPHRLLWVEQLFIDAAFRIGIAFNKSRRATGGPAKREAPTDHMFAGITHTDWRTLSNVAIAKRLGVAVRTAQVHRPVGIPTPGATREYLSSSTRSALAARRRP